MRFRSGVRVSSKSQKWVKEKIRNFTLELWVNLDSVEVVGSVLQIVQDDVGVLTLGVASGTVYVVVQQRQLVWEVPE